MKLHNRIICWHAWIENHLMLIVIVVAYVLAAIGITALLVGGGR